MIPLIGMTALLNEETKKTYATSAGYVESVILSGGIPLMIPPSENMDLCKEIIQKLDGLLIPGGPDVSPSIYNEEPYPGIGYFRKNVDLFEIEMVRLAVELNKPVLGICRGMQLINVAFGGSLYQDLPRQYKNEICHAQNINIRDEPTHKVYLEESSYISKLLKSTVIEVNSYHHQAVKNTGHGLNIVGKSKDGVIEAIESSDGSIIGVQWHPELMIHRFKQFQNLFSNFISKCRP